MAGQVAVFAVFVDVIAADLGGVGVDLGIVVVAILGALAVGADTVAVFVVVGAVGCAAGAVASGAVFVDAVAADLRCARIDLGIVVVAVERFGASDFLGEVPVFVFVFAGGRARHIAIFAVFVDVVAADLACARMDLGIVVVAILGALAVGADAIAVFVFVGTVDLCGDGDLDREGGSKALALCFDLPSVFEGSCGRRGCKVCLKGFGLAGFDLIGRSEVDAREAKIIASCADECVTICTRPYGGSDVFEGPCFLEGIACLDSDGVGWGFLGEFGIVDGGGCDVGDVGACVVMADDLCGGFSAFAHGFGPTLTEADTMPVHAPTSAVAGLSFADHGAGSRLVFDAVHGLKVGKGCGRPPRVFVAAGASAAACGKIAPDKGGSVDCDLGAGFIHSAGG